MESNCSMIEKIPPKGVSFSDFICTFAMLLDRAVSQTLQIVCNLDLLCFLNVHVLLWIDEAGYNYNGANYFEFTIPLPAGEIENR